MTPRQRRVRAVGELLGNQYRIGLVRMERRDQGAHEPPGDRDAHAARPDQRQAVTAVIKEFFGSSQLSQFMDQTIRSRGHPQAPPLALGRGPDRERAGFEVRDVHPTHYGRICPIETPEGRTSASASLSPSPA